MTEGYRLGRHNPGQILFLSLVLGHDLGKSQGGKGGKDQKEQPPESSAVHQQMLPPPPLPSLHSGCPLWAPSLVSGS